MPSNFYVLAPYVTQTRRHLSGACMVFVFACSSLASASTTIEFDQSSSTYLPYSESGITFENVIPPASPVGATNRLFFTGSGGSAPYHVRAEGSRPFQLNSIEIGIQLGPWRIESSSGSEVVFDFQADDVSLPTTLDFSNLTGWSDIEYFDIIHDYSFDRRHLWVDNIQLQFVPEPSTFGWIAVISMMIPLRTARRIKEDRDTR